MALYPLSEPVRAISLRSCDGARRFTARRRASEIARVSPQPCAAPRPIRWDARLSIVGPGSWHSQLSHLAQPRRKPRGAGGESGACGVLMGDTTRHRRDRPRVARSDEAAPAYQQRRLAQSPETKRRMHGRRREHKSASDRQQELRCSLVVSFCRWFFARTPRRRASQDREGQTGHAGEIKRECSLPELRSGGKTGAGLMRI